MLTDRSPRKGAASSSWSNSADQFRRLSSAVIELYNRDLIDLHQRFRHEHEEAAKTYGDLETSYPEASPMRKRVEESRKQRLAQIGRQYETSARNLRARLTSVQDGTFEPSEAVVHRQDGTVTLDPVVRVVPGVKRKELADRVIYEIDRDRVRTPVIECTEDATIVANHDHETLVGALALEATRFGEPVELSGSPAFVAKVQEIARALNIQVAVAAPAQTHTVEASVDRGTDVPDDDVDMERSQSAPLPTVDEIDPPKVNDTAIQSILAENGCKYSSLAMADKFTDGAASIAYRVLGSSREAVRTKGGAYWAGIVVRANPVLPVALVIKTDAQLQPGDFVHVNAADGDLSVEQITDEELLSAAKAAWEPQQDEPERSSENEQGRGR